MVVKYRSRSSWGYSGSSAGPGSKGRSQTNLYSHPSLASDPSFWSTLCELWQHRELSRQVLHNFSLQWTSLYFPHPDLHGRRIAHISRQTRWQRSKRQHPPSSTVAGAKPGKREGKTTSRASTSNLLSAPPFFHLWAYAPSGSYDGSYAFELAYSFEVSSMSRSVGSRPTVSSKAPLASVRQRGVDGHGSSLACTGVRGRKAGGG